MASVSSAAILTADDVRRKLKRLALEVAEQNADESVILVVGVAGNGETVARCLSAEIEALSYLSVDSATVHLNKREPGDANLQPAVDINNRVVLLVDDVANTGRTLFYALKPFLSGSPKKVQTLALVERSHKLFPVHTDYTGLSITTTLQEHIVVEAEGDTITGAWLH